MFWSVGLWTSDTEKTAETREVDRVFFEMEYVISLSDISEVLEVPKCIKLRRIKRWVLEVANVRGRTVHNRFCKMSGLPAQLSQQCS